MTAEPIEVGTGAAARALGVSSARVRQLHAAGRLDGRRTPEGLRITIVSLDAEQARRAEGSDSRTAPLPPPSLDPDALLARRDVELASTSARLEQAHGLARELGDRAARSEVRLEMTQQRLTAALADVAALRAEHDALVAEVARLTATAEVVRTEQQPARRGLFSRKP